MRVVHIIPSLRKGGAERLALDICIELSKRQGVEVALVSLYSENAYSDLSSQIQHHIIPSKVVPSLTKKATVDIADLMMFLRGFKPDVIHSHLFEAEMVSRHELLAGVKYFTHCHDNMHQLNTFSIGDLVSKKRITELYERNIILKQYGLCNNSFVAISKHTEAYFKHVLPTALAKRVHQIHNAINFNVFNKAAHERPVRPIKLVNAGSFVPKKNQRFLVDVMQWLTIKGIDAHLTLLGDGGLYKEVRQRISALGLEGKVDMPGNVSNLPDYLHDANVYVHSATYEPFGLVLVEAMAAGLPVVCLNGGGNADLIVQNSNGVMIEPTDVAKFGEAILAITKEQTAYNTMSSYAINYAKQFDIKPYTDKLLGLYNS